jgi:hypothetical protein
MNREVHVRIITGDRGSGKTEAMLNWFLDPFNGFGKRLIVVPNPNELQFIQQRVRSWGHSNRVPPVDMAHAHRRVVVWGPEVRRVTQGMDIQEVWVDNLDTIIAQELRLHVLREKFTASMTSPVAYEHIVVGWSTLKEVKGE